MTEPKRIVLYTVALAGAGLLFYRVLSDSSAPASPETPPETDAGARRSAAKGPRPAWRPDGETDPQRAGLLRLSGRVRQGGTGRGVAGARVLLRGAGAEASAESDGKGRFELSLGPGRYRATVSAAHYIAPASSANAELLLEPVEGSRRAANVDFVLYRAARVAGRVVDGHARPLAGATVALHRARGAHDFGRPRAETKSDVKGRFSLEVPPAEIVLRASAPQLGVALSQPVYLRAGADVTGIEIALGSGLSLGGQVIGPERQRVGAGARVHLSDEHGTRVLHCDEEGRFTTANLSPGKKLLQAHAAGFSPSRVSAALVRPGASNKVRLTLAARRIVAGRVIDAAGQPAAGVTVTAHPGSPRRRPTHLLEPLSADTDSLGRFELTGVPDVPLRVSAAGPGNSRASRAGVAPGTRDLRLQLQATGGITGRLSDGRGGRPIRAFTVIARRAAFGAGRAIRIASPTGRYHLRDLVAGRYQLTFAASGYGPTTLPRIDVVAGSDVAAHAVLNGGGRISGVVVDRRGMPLPGAEVKMETGWTDASVFTGSTGGFLLEDVARGRRSLTASHPAYDTRILAGVSVFAGQTAVVRVELTRSTGKGAALRLTGIGAVLADRDGALTVVKVLPGSPALVAGLLAGDVIDGIDGRPSHGQSFGEAIDAIRGLAGTPVRLRIKRREQSFAVDVVRDEVAVPKS